MGLLLRTRAGGGICEFIFIRYIQNYELILPGLDITTISRQKWGPVSVLTVARVRPFTT